MRLRPLPPKPSKLTRSTIEYCKGVDCSGSGPVLDCTCSQSSFTNLRRPAISDDAADYGGSSDAESENDQVPSRLPARAECAFWRMTPSRISASFMRDSDAHHHRRNRRRSASVTRPHATPGPGLHWHVVPAPPQAVTVAVDIKTKLGELALQHRANASSSAPASDFNRNRVLSVCLLRTVLLPRVMTTNKAASGHGLILLMIYIYSIIMSPSPIPDLPGKRGSVAGITEASTKCTGRIGSRRHFGKAGPAFWTDLCTGPADAGAHLDSPDAVSGERRVG
jgi:hypothetical protein